jgi:hypothetical protein
MNEIARIFGRLEAVLDAETDALLSGLRTDLAANADTKARLLLELTMAKERVEASQEARLAWQNASAALARNARMLDRHLRATRHVASALAGALRSEDSDGTYGQPSSKRADHL